MPTGRVIGIGVMAISGVEFSLRNILLMDAIVTVSCLLLGWAIHRFRHTLIGGERRRDGEIPYRRMFTMAWHLAPVAMLGAAGQPGTLRLVVANTLGIAETGLLAFLQSLQRLISRYLPGVLLRGMVRPVLVSRYMEEGGYRFVEAGFNLLLKSNFLIVAGAMTVVAGLGDEIVAALSGDRFADAGSVLFLMMTALIFSSQGFVIAMALQVTGHTSLLRNTAIVNPIALFLVWWLAPGNLETVVIIMGIGSAVSNSLILFLHSRQMGQAMMEWRGYGAILFATSIAVGCVFAMRTTLGVEVTTAIGIAALIAGLVVAKPYVAAEMALVQRVVGEKRVNLFARLFSRA